MRGTGKSFWLVAGALTALTSAGLGCQHSLPSQAPLEVRQAPWWAAAAQPGDARGAAPGRGAAAESPAVALAVGRPGGENGLARLVTDGEPAVSAERPVVWRASSRSLDGDTSGGVRRVDFKWRPGDHHQGEPVQNQLPKELLKVTQPPYVIEPPDILLIDVLRMIPRPPYKIEPLDEIVVQIPANQLLPNEPIAGVFPVEPDGKVNLGYGYGAVVVAGMTTQQAAEAVQKYLGQIIKMPNQVVVALSRTRGLQQIRGEHLVRGDGTVHLGVYGDIYVAGLNLQEAKAAIEAHLKNFVMNPEVSVDVLAYNSKVYYIVFDGGGYGQQVLRFPHVGNETVLDAISLVTGLPASASDKKIWVARPVPGAKNVRQILPVDWGAITAGAATNTNYQLFPGDRIYVKADHWIAFENRVSKFVAPFERLLGFTLLGNTTIRAVDGQQGGGVGGGGF